MKQYFENEETRGVQWGSDDSCESIMQSVRPSAAVLSFSPLHSDARVLRQIRVLSTICRVTAMGWTDPCMDGVRFVDVSGGPRTVRQTAQKACRLKARRFETVYRSDESVRKAATALRGHSHGLIVANDIDALPVALMYRGPARVLYDAHEYAPRQFESWFLWRFFMQAYKEYLCRIYIPQVDAMTTVGPTIAQEYAHRFDVRPAVVLNAPGYHAIPCIPRNGRLIRMVHHGNALRQRRLEVMIDAMAQLDDRFRLDFMLIPNSSGYLPELKERASSNPRITFSSPVDPTEIVERLKGYDVGLYSLPPYSFNARYALPNKFFDFIQARLCVAIGPSPEMKTLVEQHGCGVVAKDFTAQALAETLRALDRRKVEACRRASDAAAADLCYERGADVLLAMARRLLGLDEEDRVHREAPA